VSKTNTAPTWLVRQHAGAIGAWQVQSKGDDGVLDSTQPCALERSLWT